MCECSVYLFSQNTSSSVGEILLSISYLPAANRLGVVVMKARDLQSHKLKDIIGMPQITSLYSVHLQPVVFDICSCVLYAHHDHALD